MRRFVYILVISICLFPNLIKASECSNEDRARLQKFADNVTYTLEEMNDGSFSISFYGVSDEIRIYNPDNLLYYRNILNSEIGETVINNLKFGSKYRFIIQSASMTCLMDRFRTITINVPSKNPYYNDSICENAKEYKLCQKWENVNVSYEEFTNKVNEYIKQKQTKPNDNPIIENNKNNFDFFEIYNKYYWPTFIGMICLLILLIILWIKQNKKNKL